MRAKRSSTAIGIESRSGPSNPPAPSISATEKAVPKWSTAATIRRASCPTLASAAIRRPLPTVQSESRRNTAGIAQGLGLAHDARNLIGALGLYRDPLLRPGVLKPEHTHYATELGLLGRRSAHLLQRLMLALAAPVTIPSPAESSMGLPRQASLREITERCSGLLRSVAGGRPIELSFGPAVSVPIMAAVEDVERVLVNLVRNATAALDACNPARPSRRKVLPSLRRPERTPRSIGLLADPAQPNPSIRISIGNVDDPIAYYRPHPFLHTRLTVEDRGYGMDRKQLGRLLADAGPSLIPRGIGFQVVRELVEANGASLSIRSAPGAGTSVQIEWPAQMAWPLALSAPSAAPTPAQQPPWPPLPVASTKSAQASESRWTA